MAKTQRRAFSIPTEELAKILLTDEHIPTWMRVERLDAIGAWNQDYLDNAEEKAKTDAVRAWYGDYHASQARRRDTVNVPRKLPGGEVVRAYKLKEKASLPDLQAAEAESWQRANTSWREAMELRSLAEVKFGAQIGLPFEFEARAPQMNRPRATRAQRQPKTPMRRHPEKSK
jgi:hypothetical protein